MMFWQSFDRNGNLLCKVASNNNQPAFVLNNSSKNAGVNGANKVLHFTEEKEFVMENIRLARRNRKNELSWEGSVTDLAAYQFEILKSTDGVQFVQAGR